jgi:hypothetical protein
MAAPAMKKGSSLSMYEEMQALQRRVVELTLEAAKAGRLEVELQRTKDELAGCGSRAAGLRDRVERLEAVNEELRGRLARKG